MGFTYVLVPTDFSDPANLALSYTLEEATLHHAKTRWSASLRSATSISS